MSKVQEVWDKLRPYQQEGVKFLSHRDAALNYDDMGLGKTLSTLVVLEKLHPNETGPFNFLIVCPTKALYVWQEEIKKWFDKDSIVYTGTVAQRKKIWDKFLHSYQCDYLITTYGMVEEVIEYTQRDMHAAARFGLQEALAKYTWEAIVADEIHDSGLLNQKTKTFKIFDKVCREIPYRYFLTGTGVRQGVIDLYAPLHLVDRYRFDSYWHFVGKYCITIKTPFGKSIERRPRSPEEFRTIINNYMLRRIKTEVLDDLPGKQRQIIYVEMSKKQATLYDELLNNMIAVDDDNVIITPNKMSLILRLRQLLVCPRLLGIDEDGAALTQMISMIQDLIEVNEPVVIFTPFRQAVQFIENAINEAISKVKIYAVHGDMKPEEFARQWQGFQNNTGKRKILICTIKSGASFHATESANCFFLGYEWDFNLEAQSEDRLCRIGQKNFVNCRYMMHKETVDEDVAQRLNDKQEASNWIIGTEEQYSLLLKRYKVKISGNK